MSQKLYQARVEDGQVFIREFDATEYENAIQPHLRKTKHDAVMTLIDLCSVRRDKLRYTIFEANAELSELNASIRALETWREE